MDKIKKGKWQTIICNDQNMGINTLLLSGLKSSPYGYMIDHDTKVVFHSYRQIGTTVEVNVELKYDLSHMGFSSLVKFLTVCVG